MIPNIQHFRADLQLRMPKRKTHKKYYKLSPLLCMHGLNNCVMSPVKCILRHDCATKGTEV